VSQVLKKGNGIESLKRRLKKSGTVDIGIIDAGKHDEAELTVANIGDIHEFGSDKAGIPERSFIRSTTTEKRNEIAKLQNGLAKKIINGSITQEDALGLIGERVKSLIEDKIETLKEPPNAQRTLDAKKPKTNPLVDSSQLLNSITYRVNI
jgi:hypothetical protein